MEYAGVLLGGDTDISIAQVDGLLDLPDITSGDQVRLRRHGLHPGDDFLSSRAVTVTAELYGDDAAAFQTAVDSFLTMSKPGDDELPLHFQIPGVAGGVKSLIYARPRRRQVPIGREFYYRNPTATVQFVATDPRIYSADVSSFIVPVATTSAGVAFDMTANIVFGTGGESGAVTANNAGNFETEPVFRIDGPCVNPRIENVTTGETFAIDITLTEAEYLVVNVEERTVLLGGTASRYSFLTSSSQWVTLAPGDNSIAFRATSSGAGATLTATWRSARV